MTNLTPLDKAHAAMDADETDDAARLKFYERLADSELFLLLKDEARDETMEPELLDLDAEDGGAPEQYALVFDNADRLGTFAAEHKSGAMPYAALPGRVIATMLKGQKIGLALNLGVAPSSILVPDIALEWLADTLAGTPETSDERQLTGIDAPLGLPDALISGLEEKLVNAIGLASHAVFAKGTFSDDSEGWLLAFIDAAPGAEEALARATQEALIFSGTDLASVDVAFFSSGDPICEHLDHLGLRYDFPDPEAEERDDDGAVTRAPGSDPAKPPILKH
jgi:hypothetical protein